MSKSCTTAHLHCHWSTDLRDVTCKPSTHWKNQDIGWKSKHCQYIICTTVRTVLPALGFYTKIFVFFEQVLLKESWHNHSPLLSLINWWHGSEGSLASSEDIKNQAQIFITFFTISSFTAHIQRFWMQITNSAVSAKIFISQKWVLFPIWLRGIAISTDYI